MLTRSVLRGWWCADDWTNTQLVTDDGSGVLSSWKDRINGIAATAATTARPTASATAFDGLAGVTFDGVANAMTATAGLSALPNGAEPGEVWVVGKNPATSGTHTWAGYGQVTSGQPVGRSLNTISNSGVRRLQVADGQTGAISFQDPITNPVIGSGWWDGTTSGGFQNGTPFTTTKTVTPNTPTTRLRLGAGINTSAGAFLPGVLRHVFATTLMPPNLRDRLTGWCAWDSGLQSLLPSDHPYRSAPP